MDTQTIEQLNAQLDRYGKWMRAHGRRSTAKARSVAASMQVLRDEISRRGTQ